MRSSLLLILSFLPQVALALGEKNSICDDLAKYACAAAPSADGTESQAVQGGSNDERLKLAFGKFKNILAKPESASLRQALLASSGLSVLPDCQQSAEQMRGRCLELLASAATDYLRWGYHMGSQSENQLRNLATLDERYYILQRPEFVTIQKEFGQSPQAEAGVAQVAERVKSILLVKIKDKVKDPAVAKLMAQRVAALSLQGADCADWQEGEVSRALTPEVRYQVGSRSIRYCRGSFSSAKSEFEMAYLLANEMAHAIDPCNIARGPKEASVHYRSSVEKEAEREYPVSHLLTCLHERGLGGEQGSVQRPSALTDIMSPAWPYVASVKNESVVLCNGDQLSDVAAEWWATEVLPEYMAKYHANLTQEQKRSGYANAIRSRCAQPQFAPLKSGAVAFSSSQERLSQLLLAHPKVRSQMGCSDAVAQRQGYCSGEALGPEMPSARPAGARK